jgi:hypothetical protein
MFLCGLATKLPYEGSYRCIPAVSVDCSVVDYVKCVVNRTTAVKDKTRNMQVLEILNMCSGESRKTLFLFRPLINVDAR